MDGHERVGKRIGRQAHETDRYSIDLLALVYQALLDDLPPRGSSIGSEQQACPTPQNQPLVQEAQP